MLILSVRDLFILSLFMQKGISASRRLGDLEAKTTSLTGNVPMLRFWGTEPILCVCERGF